MKKFEGVWTAVVTPFKNGEVDYKSLKNLIEFQLAGGIHGIVVNGTTGESPTLTSEERAKIFKSVKEIVGSKIPLLMGTGSNNTVTTVKNTLEAKELGADGALVVVPYYNKPPQRGLLSHFKTVAESVGGFPIMLYDVPARTVAALSSDTTIELSKIPNIVGIKDATGNIEHGSRLVGGCREGFTVVSGDDGTFDRLLSVGGKGVISVVSNFAPKETVDLYESNRAGHDSSTTEKLFAIIESLNFDTNPIPIKSALKLKKIIETSELRPPLAQALPKDEEALLVKLKAIGALS